MTYCIDNQEQMLMPLFNLIKCNIGHKIREVYNSTNKFKVLLLTFFIF